MNGNEERISTNFWKAWTTLSSRFVLRKHFASFSQSCNWKKNHHHLPYTPSHTHTYTHKHKYFLFRSCQGKKNNIEDTAKEMEEKGSPTNQIKWIPALCVCVCVCSKYNTLWLKSHQETWSSSFFPFSFLLWTAQSGPKWPSLDLWKQNWSHTHTQACRMCVVILSLSLSLAVHGHCVST